MSEFVVLPDTWTGVDGLGRSLPRFGDEGIVNKEQRDGRFVGMFYWTWHCGHAPSAYPRNVSKIIEKFPEAVNDFNHPVWEGMYSPHHWNEPLFGYYNTTDRWVLRKHAEMLADAGVDVVIFDNTNGTFTWRDSYVVLMEVFAEARRDGVNAPYISFILPFAPNHNTNVQLEMLYTDIYKQNKYPELWFHWKGKPMIMAYPDALDAEKNPLHREIIEFFNFKPGQPSYTRGQDRPDQWGWLSVYPQQVYRNEDGTPEQITVGVAQNHSKELGLTAMNGKNVFGRTYTSKGYDTREDAVLYGANFSEQFEYALEVDPEFIFITGWNEWVAGRYKNWQGVKNAFPDQFNDYFSRDIEPSAGKLGDNYYYQLVSFVRRYKGMRKPEPASPAKTIDIHSGDLSQWDNVKPEYCSYRNNTFKRDADGYRSVRYYDDSGRNDIILSKVTHDDQNVYFLVQTTSDITPPSGTWMQLFIKTHSEKPDYDFVVSGSSVCRFTDSQRKEICGTAEYTVSKKSKNHMMLKISKEILNITDNKFSIDFKWADNLPDREVFDIFDFYLYGNAAPGGRFNFHYDSSDRYIPVYPMKMKPEPKKIIWGGDRLKKDYNKTAPFDRIAESWELTVRDDGMNIIENGICKDMTLGEYIEKYGNDVISKDYCGDRFPLLIKFIDACDKLSIQVHPDDEYSLKNEGEYGKTEMWYIVEADEGAQIVYGLKSDITREDFNNAVNDGKTESVLNYVNVKKGDVYFIPSGLIHAIGSGILIAEIQQNSNVTYRVYDYDRRQPDGSLRQLHTEKALAVTELYTDDEIEKIQYSKNIKTDTSLASCKYFTVDKYSISDSLKLTADENSFHSVMCIDGKGEIRFGDEIYSVEKGDSYFIPAGMGEYEISGSLDIIVSKI